MTEKNKTTALEWAKFTVGAGSFSSMLYIHYVVGNEINLLVFGIPALLMGLDPSKIIGWKK